MAGVSRFRVAVSLGERGGGCGLANRSENREARIPGGRGEHPLERPRDIIQGGRVIVGLGVDIVEVDRIARAIERYGRQFQKRVFTPREIEYCESHRAKFERYAGRFAAKEAAMKALGTGWRRGVRFVDIEVVRERSGKPLLELSGAARKFAEQMGVRNITVSITHSNNTALAQVVFES